MSESAPARSTSHRFRRWLLVVLVVLLVASVAWIVWIFTTREVDAFGLDGGTQTQTGDRNTVQSQARQFMLRVNEYGPDDLDDKNEMPGYRKSVGELLTAKFNASFLESVGFAEQTVAAGASHTGVVYATGVSTIDQDSATVIVAGSFTVTYDTKDSGGPQTSDPVAYRVIVSLVKTKGAWLIDDYQPEPSPTDQDTSIPSFPTSAPAVPGGSSSPSGTASTPAPGGASTPAGTPAGGASDAPAPTTGGTP